MEQKLWYKQLRNTELQGSGVFWGGLTEIQLSMALPSIWFLSDSLKAKKESDVANTGPALATKGCEEGRPTGNG